MSDARIRQSFVFAALLLLCGQALASPFLACRHEHAAIATLLAPAADHTAGSMEEHCAGMAMAQHNGGHHGMDEAPAAPLPDDDSSNCDLGCRLLCQGPAAPLALESSSVPACSGMQLSRSDAIPMPPGLAPAAQLRPPAAA
jgi:hypothetical protein